MKQLLELEVWTHENGGVGRRKKFKRIKKGKLEIVRYGIQVFNSKICITNA